MDVYGVLWYIEAILKRHPQLQKLEMTLRYSINLLFKLLNFSRNV